MIVASWALCFLGGFFCAAWLGVHDHPWLAVLSLCCLPSLKTEKKP